jgi:AhpD family alkylhydroperoxidase
MKSAQRKRTFALFGFLISLLNVLLRVPRLLMALVHPSTSAALREEVMLSCTSVNACRYCNWLHTRLALKHEVDVDGSVAILAMSKLTAFVRYNYPIAASV